MIILVIAITINELIYYKNADVKRTLISKDKSIKDIRQVFLDEIEKLEETLKIYISGKDPITLKTEYTAKWNYLSKKLAYPYDHIKSVNVYQLPVNNFK